MHNRPPRASPPRKGARKALPTLADAFTAKLLAKVHPGCSLHNPFHLVSASQVGRNQGEHRRSPCDWVAVKDATLGAAAAACTADTPTQEGCHQALLPLAGALMPAWAANDAATLVQLAQPSTLGPSETDGMQPRPSAHHGQHCSPCPYDWAAGEEATLKLCGGGSLNSPLSKQWEGATKGQHTKDSTARPCPYDWAAGEGATLGAAAAEGPGPGSVGPCTLGAQEATGRRQILG